MFSMYLCELSPGSQASSHSCEVNWKLEMSMDVSVRERMVVLSFHDEQATCPGCLLAFPQ